MHVCERRFSSQFRDTNFHSGAWGGARHFTLSAIDQYIAETAVFAALQADSDLRTFEIRDLLQSLDDECLRSCRTTSSIARTRSISGRSRTRVSRTSSSSLRRTSRESRGEFGLPCLTERDFGALFAGGTARIAT
jgi:hypothetical protein